jgi:hypothetical protein
MGRREMHIRYWWESDGKRPLGRLGRTGVGMRILLKCILERWIGVVRNGFIWIRIEIGGGFL